MGGLYGYQGTEDVLKEAIRGAWKVDDNEMIIVNFIYTIQVSVEI